MENEYYVPNLIEGILNQNNKNIELILVDDGSTDNSYEICEYYRNNDQRVQTIRKENGGICSARNIGLENATGEWISFVDQDDIVEKDMFLVMAESVDDDVDMIIAGKEMYVVDIDGKIISKKEYNYPASIIGKREFLPYQTNIYKKNEFSHLWNCLYRASILRSSDLSFNMVFKYGFEDTLFNLEYSCRCEKIKFINKSVYNYYRRKASSTSFKKNENYLNELIEYLNVSSVRLNAMEYDSKEKQYLIYQFLLKHCINLFSMYGISKPLNEAKKDLQVISNALKAVVKPTVKKNRFTDFKEIIYVRTISFLLIHNCCVLLKIVLEIKKLIENQKFIFRGKVS